MICDRLPRIRQESQVTKKKKGRKRIPRVCSRMEIKNLENSSSFQDAYRERENGKRCKRMRKLADFFTRIEIYVSQLIVAVYR